MTPLPQALVDALAAQRAACGVTEVISEELQHFVVTTVCRRANDTLDSFTALNKATQKIWHFMGGMVAETDLTKVRPNAQFWEISALQNERSGSRVRSVVLMWED